MDLVCSATQQALDIAYEAAKFFGDNGLDGTLVLLTVLFL